MIFKGTVVSSWILSGIILVMIIYGPYPFVDEKIVPVQNLMLELAYGVIYRTLWSSIIALIIFFCFHGYGGTENK